MSKKFIFTFKDIVFDTDEGDGQDESTAHVLRSKYRHSRFDIEAQNEKEALGFVVRHVSELTGYPVLDVEYDLQVS